MSTDLTFAERVAVHLAPAWWAGAHPPEGEPTPEAAELWVNHVAEVRATLRSAAVIGAGLVGEQTLSAVTGMTEGDLLIALANHYGHHEIAELLEQWMTDLRATGPDGRRLQENQTAAQAVVVHLADRTRRSS